MYNNGDEFLNKLYKEMYLEKTVSNHANKNDTIVEKVKRYLERINDVHERANTSRN